MMRRWLLAGVAMLMFLGGCGTDARRAEILQTLQMMDQTTSQMKTIREKIASATEKMTPDAGLDLTEAVKACEQLKDFCNKQVQRQALAMQNSKVSDSEKEQLKSEFQSQATAKVQAMNKEREELNVAVKNLEKSADSMAFKEAKKTEAEGAIKNLKEKLAAAQAEYIALCRKS